MKAGRFRLTIDLGNDAVRDCHDLGRLLVALGERMLRGDAGIAVDSRWTIRDDNGNTVGSAGFVPEGRCGSLPAGQR